MFLDTLRGLALTVVANGALLYAAHLGARRWWPSAGAPARLAATGVLALTLALAIFYPLALTGLLTPQAATLAAIAIGVAAHFRRTSCGGFWADGHSVAGWARLLVRSRGALLLAGAGLLVVSAAYRAAVWPPLSYDSLTYHNFLAGSWAQAGGFVPFSVPPAMQGYVRIPFHFEALVAWTMLPFHGDFLINFVNFPILALGAVALYALCRELGLDVFASSLAVGLVCFSPAVFAYVCTQYNDILVMSLLIAAALFLVLHLRGGRWADATMVFLASGLAVGTKHTAIPPAALLCLVAIVAPLRGAAGRWRRAAVSLALCLAIVAVAGGCAYVRNWAELGNPLYPATVRLFGRDVFPQAPVITNVTRECGRGSWRDDVAQLGRSISYAYGTEPAPLSWGPKLPVLLVLAIVALAWSGRSARRAELRWLALCWAVPALLIYLDPSDNTVAIRRFWPDAFARFLAPSVGLMAAGALVGASLLEAEWLRRTVRGGLCVLLLYDLFAMSILPDTPRVLVAVGIALPVLVGGVSLLRRLPSRVPMVVFTAFELATAVAGVCLVARVRDHWRNHFLETRVELHPFPRHFAKGWAFCDEPRDPKTIVLASYEPNLGHHWFFYPLMGRRLQNRVVYVPGEERIRGATGGTWDEDNEELAWLLWSRRRQPDPLTLGLAEVGPTHLFIQLNPDLPPNHPDREPDEMRLVRAHPEWFELVNSGEHYRVYRVLDRSFGWKTESAP
ncbi:MAG: hypothetical protein FJ290_04920 [Planctomycetes bacterium]|nr:hypothetical protein [Planctomycetota bacterium]